MCVNSTSSQLSLLQLRQVLFEELKLGRGRAIGRTGSGELSTDEATLTKLKDEHPLPGLILEHRQLAKLLSTYVEGALLGNMVSRKHIN